MLMSPSSLFVPRMTSTSVWNWPEESRSSGRPGRKGVEVKGWPDSWRKRGSLPYSARPVRDWWHSGRELAWRWSGYGSRCCGRIRCRGTSPPG